MAIQTNNEAWGLWGTATMNGQNASELWARCINWLQTGYGMEEIDARNFLDSKHGRHLADALTGMTLDEIDTQWGRYMRAAVYDIKAARAEFDA